MLYFWIIFFKGPIAVNVVFYYYLSVVFRTQYNTILYTSPLCSNTITQRLFYLPTQITLIVLIKYFFFLRFLEKIGNTTNVDDKPIIENEETNNTKLPVKNTDEPKEKKVVTKSKYLKNEKIRVRFVKLIKNIINIIDQKYSIVFLFQSRLCVVI